MVIKPRIRGFICTNAHPTGCAKNVQDQIAFVKARPQSHGAKSVLVVGCSTGYGLASRISAAYLWGADTLGISLEREPDARRSASAGWYNNVAFDYEALQHGLESKTLNGDAFSTETKEETIEIVRKDFAPIDLLVYSLASPVRTDPLTGETHRSSIKPIGDNLNSRTLQVDVLKDHCEVVNVDLEAAEDSEIASTVAVMGGEDWERWIHALNDANVLSSKFKTVSYTYLGNELTKPIYRGGTLGRAKEDLDRVCRDINSRFRSQGMEALVAVLKAVVTQASTAIPVVPLYFSILFKVMKEIGTHEDCIAHIHRLFSQQLYGQDRRTDSEGRIRMDNFELDSVVQDRVSEAWDSIDSSNARGLADIEGFKDDFLRLFGFGRSDIDYDLDVDPILRFP